MTVATPLIERLLKRAVDKPDAPFLVSADWEISYSAFLNDVKTRASHFAGCGLTSSKRVAIYCEDEIEFQTSLFAIWWLGGVCIPMNVTQRPEVLAKIERIVAPDIAFSDLDALPGQSADFPCHPLRPDASPDQHAYEVPAESDAAQPAIIMFTSGTSGTPKAVPMSAAALAENSRLTAEAMQITIDDRILINSPPYYTSPIIHILTLMEVGGSIAIHQGMMLGGQLAERLVSLQCTGFGGVPVHLIRLAGIGTANLKTLPIRFLMNSGEHLPVPIIEKLCEARPDVRLFCVYGLTEVAGRLCLLSPDRLPEKAGSVGRPLGEMTIEIRDDEGRLDTGETGQVFVRGPLLMDGYINNETADHALTEHGFATGDFGTLDEEGFLYLSGRNDDIVKVGGEKVSISLIEEAGYRIEAFREHVAVPVRDENMGNVLYLIYSVKDGASIKRKEIIRILRGHLPSNHIPVGFVEVPEIPRATSGKISRKELAVQLTKQ